ncbi:hypothetical protein CROQUDRAFT_137251 [Cronartium quercuum f. sp. fusiforme G11]|uniref:Uncharacterized protein n=1 Tax=Cronartium quercuum f. sp. fusiforme G11 TaxID=708437 RepID=A0A9P6N4Z8_9BASI|nr:hypothetical protein CROQUDRAFT_137251 [Cronartium quercuum f. sp. fusiforme G11]
MPEFVTYKAIRGKYLISQNLSLFKDKCDILKTRKNYLQDVLNDLFPLYKPDTDISAAGWAVNHLIFPGFIDQINWIYNFLNEHEIEVEGIRTKDEFFKSGSTYFVELMMQWFSEYEMILREAHHRSLWHDLYDCRTEFHVENSEIAPGFVVHHLEFGYFLPCVASLSWALVSKWVNQYSAKWKNVLYPFTLSDNPHAVSFKQLYNFETKTEIVGHETTYTIVSLQRDHGWPYERYHGRSYLSADAHHKKEAKIQSRNEKASA